MFRIICIVVFCTLLTVQAKFPDDPKPCKYGDTECIAKLINNLLSEKATAGDSDINLVKLDPLLVGNMNIKQGAESPVNIDLTFNNNNIYGINKLQISRIRGFGKTIARKHELQMIVPKMSLVGPYIIKGKILILPISGTGKSNMTLVNLNWTISFTGKPYESNAETYMEATNLKIMLKPERMFYYFSNLFNGDKALGDNMNAFLNDNWEAIFMEAQNSMELALAKVFQPIITSVFSKYPYAKFFEM